jgi:hypothetical protein
MSTVSEVPALGHNWWLFLKLRGAGHHAAPGAGVPA